MTYLQIINIIKDTALAQPNVNSVVREFLDLNREDAKYSAVVIQDRDGTRDRIVENDYITYTWHLGYVDRLTYDKSNRDDIISTGINVLNNIINTIRNTWFPELEVSVVDRINTFDQRFTAECAGVYIVLAVNAQVSDCVDSESTDLYDTYDAKITANGVYHFVPTGRPVDEINITVDVPGAGKEEVSLIDTVTLNGTHTYVPAEDTVYKDVELTVDVHPTDRLIRTLNSNGSVTIEGEWSGADLTVDVVPVWGSITGTISDQTDLIGYISGVESGVKTWVESQSYITSTALSGYATESWVSAQGYLTEHQDLSSYATQSWVSSNFLSATALSGYATESWVSAQGYLTEHQDLSSYALKSEIPSLDGYATESWVSSQQFATQSWVSSQGYITSVPDTFATKSWVESQGYITSTGLSGLATQSWVETNFLSSTALTGYATESWVSAQGYLTEHQDLSSYATQSWVESQGYITSVPDTFATKSWVESQGYLTEHQSLDGYATESWVSAQGYLTEHQDLSSYATQSWVSSNFLSATALTGYATQSWVESQGYITSVPDTFATKSWVSSQGYLTSTALTGYATQSWVSNQLFYYTTTSEYAALQSRVATLEENYGDAVTITNQILG